MDDLRNENLELIRKREVQAVDRIVARMIGKELYVLRNFVMLIEKQSLPANDLFKWEQLTIEMDTSLGRIDEVVNAILYDENHAVFDD